MNADRSRPLRRMTRSCPWGAACLVLVLMPGALAFGEDAMDAGRLDRARLEALMERWKIPFRAPSAEIAGVLGMTPDIGGGEEVCALPFPEELSAGSGQLAFVPRYARAGHDRIATFLLRYGRDEGAGRAYDELVEILGRELGPGRPDETSNAHSLQWRRGPAWVKLVRFDVPTGLGAEADAFHARHCLLEIRPGWAPPPSAPETAAFARARDIAPLAGLAVHDTLGDFSRLPEEAVAADAVRHDAESATILVAAKDGSLAILPLERVGNVTFEKFFPAKGDGFVTLRIELRDAPAHTFGLPILHGPWAAREALAAWAEAFTERTGLPVEVTEDPDA